MSARSKARKRALDILFEADAKQIPAATVLAETVRRRASAGEPELNPHAVELVTGVEENRAAIDSALQESLQEWDLHRLPAVDRQVLRLGAFEVMFRDDVPDAVAIDEAVSLATSLSTDDSPAFVNGVLGSVARRQAQQAQAEITGETGVAG